MSIAAGLLVSLVEGLATWSLNVLTGLVVVGSNFACSVKEVFCRNNGVREATGDPSGFSSPDSSKL